MADIKEINELFETECTRTKEIHEKIAVEHINSLLYFNDVENNKNLLGDLNNKINDIRTQLKTIAKNCELKGSDAIKERASILSSYETYIANSSNMINSILLTITNKLKLVYDEKKLEYDTNFKEINRYIDDYNEKYKRYEDANNKKTDNSYKEHYTDLDEDREKYKQQKEYYEKQRVKYLLDCENDVEQIKKINDSNNELLEKFLKKVDESIQL